MKSKHLFLLIFTLLIGLSGSFTNKSKAQPNSVDPEVEYQKIKDKLLTGWNTWDTRSVLTHVYLPDGVALILGLEDTQYSNYKEHFFTGNRTVGTEQVRPIAHTPDGTYTCLSLEWQNIYLKVRTAAEGNDLFIMITPDSRLKGKLHIKSEMIYGDKGEISINKEMLQIKTPENNLNFYVNGSRIDTLLSGTLVYNLEEPVYISSQKIPIEEIIKKIDTAEKKWLEILEPYDGPFNEAGLVYSAIQNAVNWLQVFDPQLNRIVTPVSRNWANGWGKGKPGGFVLFCWDNFFVSWMHSLESKELAYNEAIQLCNLIDEAGFVPNYAGPNGIMSRDRSQPPVGSMCIKKIYDKYKELWFLEYNFDKLMTWNRWWHNTRNNNGLLSWGSTPFISETGDKREISNNNHLSASRESGWDNSPMHDDFKFDTITHMFNGHSVALNSLYVMDCEALAYLAKELGRDQEYHELKKREENYREKMKVFWNDEVGFYLNKYVGSKKFSMKLSPSGFYPLLARVPSLNQANRMIVEHFYNPYEFWGEWILPSISRNDKDYTGHEWLKGSIWGPINLLVYWGFKNYSLPHAKKDLAEKSKNLLLKNWVENGTVRENYHGETGGYTYRSEPFYHWGALLGMIYLEENGYLAE